MEISVLDIREEAYERLGIAELPSVDHVHYSKAIRIIERELKRCLESHAWYFARKRVSLSRVGSGFPLPEDFLSLLWCSRGSYELIGSELRCLADCEVEILYISRACLSGLIKNDFVELPGYFVDCVAYKVAERLAPMVLGGGDRQVPFLQLYDKALAEAKYADVCQYASNGRVVAPYDAMTGEDGDFYPAS